MAGCYMQSILSMSIFSWNAQYPLHLYCCQHHSFHHWPMGSLLMNSQAPSHDLLISRTLTQLWCGPEKWPAECRVGTSPSELVSLNWVTCFPSPVCVCWVCTLCGCRSSHPHKMWLWCSVQTEGMISGNISNPLKHLSYVHAYNYYKCLYIMWVWGWMRVHVLQTGGRDG